METSAKRLTSLVRMVALICAACLVTQWQFANAETNITVQVDHPGAAIPPTLFGLFFEDINFAADGGLYPERVKNRSFEFPDPLMGWKQTDGKQSKGAIYILDRGSVKSVPNSHYLRIKTEADSKGFGLANEGFRGIGVQAGAEYAFSLKARRVASNPVSLRIELQDADGTI